MSQLNGALLTGGSADFFNSTSTSLEFTNYSEKGCFIFEMVKYYNDLGFHYPLWATCLGFELIHVCANISKNTVSNVNGEPSYIHNVELTHKIEDSPIFRHRDGDRIAHYLERR
mmetsp:Transcript_29569/g.5339  ORF Transcript_29569/g.5339 Transcript_29569/m.5339 type:complete len:114 (+) Transcript_29569:364-705(+)